MGDIRPRPLPRRRGGPGADAGKPARRAAPVRVRGPVAAAAPLAPGESPTDRLEAWFAANGWRAFDFQREVWSAYLAGESGLVHSATGSGKTLAAFLGPLAEWLATQPPQPGPGTGQVPGTGVGQVPALRVLWLTPMRALAADTRISL